MAGIWGLFGQPFSQEQSPRSKGESCWMSPIHWAQPKICVTLLFPSAPVHPSALGTDSAYSLFGPGVSSAPTWLEQVTCGQHLDIQLAPQQAHLRLSLKGSACCLKTG